jgi:hypothetical protein
MPAIVARRDRRVQQGDVLKRLCRRAIGVAAALLHCATQHTDAGTAGDCSLRLGTAVLCCAQTQSPSVCSVLVITAAVTAYIPRLLWITGRNAAAASAAAVAR